MIASAASVFAAESSAVDISATSSGADDSASHSPRTRPISRAKAGSSTTSRRNFCGGASALSEVCAGAVPAGFVQPPAKVARRSDAKRKRLGLIVRIVEAARWLGQPGVRPRSRARSKRLGGSPLASPVLIACAALPGHGVSSGHSGQVARCNSLTIVRGSLERCASFGCGWSVPSGTIPRHARSHTFLPPRLDSAP